MIINEKCESCKALAEQLKQKEEEFNNAIELSKIYKKQIFKSSEKALKYSQALQEIYKISCQTDSQHPESVANMVSVIRHRIKEVLDANIQP